MKVINYRSLMPFVDANQITIEKTPIIVYMSKTSKFGYNILIKNNSYSLMVKILKVILTKNLKK
jgi:hypothetical protein